MFWSLILEPGKTYSSTVKESFHLSMATLDVKTVKNDKDIFPVKIEIDGQTLLLCNLCKLHNLHANLDLVFESGTKLTFSTSGTAAIHLTGYCIQDNDMDDDMEGYSSLEDEEDEAFKEKLEKTGKATAAQKGKAGANQASASKRKLEPIEAISKKKLKGAADDNDDDDDDGDDDDSSVDDDEVGKLVNSINDDEDTASESDDELDEEEGDEDSDDEGSESDGDDVQDDFEDSEEDSDDEEPKQQIAKSKKGGEKTPVQNKQNKTPVSNKKQDKQGKNQLSNGITPQSSKKDKKEKNQGNQATPKQTPKKGKEENATPQSQKKQTTVGGVTIEELKSGNGPVAKPGKMVSVYYTGRLKSNNRVFDQTNQGPGFKFRLGNNEVIKGWDIGLNGMKVGSKRRITCPPGVAYGNKGSPPQIPPNSTLVFEVELKSVN